LDRFVALYGPAIVRVPWLWGLTFRISDNELGLRIYLTTAARRFGERVAELIEHVDPVAVLSVHPLVNHLMVQARERLGRPALPLMTVITDLVDVHRFWASSGVDQYVASSDVAAGRLMDFGITPSRIATLGIPLKPEFDRMALSGRETRLKLTLDPDLTTLLLMGGGDGAGRIADTARAIAALSPQAGRFQLVVVTGRNVAARQQLESFDWPMPTRVLGFVDNVAEYMNAADVIATKPGSLTISEALALGRPLLLGPPVPGQEEGNVSYVEGAGAGLAYRTPQEAAGAFNYLLQDPSLRWEMGRHAARLNHPRAAERTLDLLQALILRSESQRLA
jgi:1,2-diacylglycerol 3-beta-galactosyltransferase